MRNVRCPKCNKMLFKYKLNGNITLQFKCTRCSEMNVITLIYKEYDRQK